MSGPIILSATGFKVTGLNREARDDGDDDCEAFDPGPQDRFADCPSDGHYRCAECSKYAPDEDWPAITVDGQGVGDG